jgi:hypothetical protein
LVFIARKRLDARFAQAAVKNVRSHIEFAAAHEKVTAGIGTYEATFVIDQLGAADGTIFPPVFPVIVFACRRFALVHIVISEKFTWVLAQDFS